MVRTMNLRLVLLGVVVIGAGGVGAEPRLSMRVSPAVAFAPANLVIRTVVAADKTNRAMEIIAESTHFYRSSETQLNGDRAPRTTMFEFRSLPGGEYQVRAILKGQGGEQLAEVQTRVNVIEGERSR